MSQMPERFLLVGIIPSDVPESETLANLTEAVSLIESYGGQVIDAILQKRDIHDKGMYIGSGKVDEVLEAIKEQRIDVVVLNSIIKPGQIYEFHKQLAQANPQIQIWDKVDLILHIFSAHAQTAESKLQIELAAMRHMGPRIYGMGDEMSQQGGGIGTRGVGETNTELMKQHWRKQIKITQDKLKKLSADRQRLIDRRHKIGLKTVSIVGYTNAGKTSVFNKLVGKKKLAANALFVTLDSTVGKIYLPNLKAEVLVSDTIGFIQDLPPELIDAFRSTLLESVNADLLLHVIDIADPEYAKKIEVVENILTSLGVDHKQKIYIFNKIDVGDFNQANLTEKYRKFQPQFTSTLNGQGLNLLKQAIDQALLV